jgi:hypothetical protein
MGAGALSFLPALLVTALAAPSGARAQVPSPPDPSDPSVTELDPRVITATREERPTSSIPTAP